MEKVATFRVKESFQLTSRGLVAVGDILGGKIEIGDLIRLNVDGKLLNLKISGIAYGNIDNNGNYFVGLNISNLSDGEHADLGTVKLEAQLSEVYRAE